MTSSTIAAAALAVVISILVCAGSACLEGGEIAFYDCKNPVPDHVDDKGQPDPCCRASQCPQGNGQFACKGDCLPIGDSSYRESPFLLWIADDPSQLPYCSDVDEKLLQYLSLSATGLSASLECDPCTCSAPACLLPSGLTANSASCPDDTPGQMHIPFDAPSNWDGACVSPTAVAPGDFASISIAPVTVSQCNPGVKPHDPPAFTLPPPRWEKYARGCMFDDSVKDTCSKSRSCLPRVKDLPAGAHRCIEQINPTDADCSMENSYPVKFRFYKQPDSIEDTRGCTACACGEPMGSDCEVTVTAYEDAACSTVPIMSSIVTLADPKPECHDIAAGMALQGMTASLVRNKPGTCQSSGGEPYGGVKPLGELHVVCCEEP